MRETITIVNPEEEISSREREEERRTRRPVDLGPILSREGSSSVSAPSTVRVDDDLASGETGVTLGTSDDEPARRLDVVHRLVVEVLGVDHLLDDLLHQLALEVLGRDLLGVLGRDDDRVDAEGLDGTVRELLVLDRDLGLRVGAEPSELARATELGHLGVELVREDEGEGHELLGFWSRDKEGSANRQTTGAQKQTNRSWRIQT